MKGYKLSPNRQIERTIPKKEWKWYRLFMIDRPESEQPLPAHATRVFKGDIFDVYQWDQELYDGSHALFEKVKRNDTVVVIPTLPQRHLLYIEEEQPGMKAISTFPAGRLEEGEDPLTGAKRELLEETGHISDEWTLLKAVQPVRKIEWAIYFFVARNCKRIADIAPDAGEKIEVKTTSLDDAIAMVAQGEIGAYDLCIEFLKAKYDPEECAKLETLLFGHSVLQSPKQ